MPPTRSLALLAALWAMTAIAGTSASGARQKEAGGASGPRLVLLYAPCTVSRDFLSPYNPDVEFTPALARMARQGSVFERHWSESGQSGTAYASILSGAQAPGHGVFSHPTRIPDSVHLLTEAFARAGWDAFFWGGHRMASARYNYAQGVPEERVFPRGLTASEPDFLEALERLRTEPSYRALFVTNFTVTHAPYSTRHLRIFCDRYPTHCEVYRQRPETVERYARLHRQHHRALKNDFPRTVAQLGLGNGEVEELARVLELLYKANIHFLDTSLGAVVEEIERRGLLAVSLIAFTADHGETLFQDHLPFKWTHGWNLAPEVLRVPWIIAGHDAGGRTRRYGPVSRSIDVFPTLAGLAGLALPAETADTLTGVDLSRALERGASPPALRALSHTPVQPEPLRTRDRGTLWWELHRSNAEGLLWVSLAERDRFYRYRMMGGGRWRFELFDLGHDPAGKNDLFDPVDPAQMEATERLKAYQAALQTAWKSAKTAPTLDKEALRALKALGYVD